MFTIVPLDLKLILKLHIKNQDLRNFKPSANCLSYLTFVRLETLLTLESHPLWNQIILCILTNQNSPIEKPKPMLFYELNWAKKIVFPFHHHLLEIKIQIHATRTGWSSSLRSMEMSTIVFFLIIISCFSCVLTLQLCFTSFKKLPVN